MIQLNQDSLVTILLCSDLGLSPEMKMKYKPFTLPQWNKLADKIISSDIQKPSVLLDIEKEDLKRELHLPNNEADRIEFLLKRGGSIAIEIEQLESKGIYITTRAEKNYPQRLKKVLKKYSPTIIFYSGDLSLVNKKGVGIVGSRDIDTEGMIYTKRLVNKCVNENYTIISGGAKGVDSIAEKTSIAEGGDVISIVADSLSKKIKEKNIRNAILERKFLVMSTVNPNARFTVYTAMDRNKYIYALSEYGVAISSSHGKGGTWSGATENLKKKWVPLFVRSGEHVPLGNKKLIEFGGIPINTEVVENNNILLKNWFESNKEELHVEDNFEQLNIYNLSKRKEEKKISPVLEEPIDKDYVEILSEEQGEERLDVYNIILPYLKKALLEPKNQDQLSEVLNVNKKQISEWIKRAIEDEKVERLKNPIRYILKENS